MTEHNPLENAFSGMEQHLGVDGAAAQVRLAESQANVNNSGAEHNRAMIEYQAAKARVLDAKAEAIRLDSAERMKRSGLKEMMIVLVLLAGIPFYVGFVVVFWHWVS